MRIVSLIPSATEIVCALGLRDNLVGVSHECDFPLDLSLPIVSRPRLDPQAPGREIDRQVRNALRNGLSLYEIDEELLAELAPDLILTQDQCEVCAVSLKDVEASVGKLTRKSTQICSLRPHSLLDVLKDFERVGAAAKVPERGRRLAEETRLFWDDLAAIDYEKKPNVLSLEWLQPPLVAGGWIPELVSIAGGNPLLVTGPTKFKEVTWSDIAEVDADQVLVFPCGYKIEKTREEILDDETSLGLSSLGLAPEGKVFLCDGNSLFNRPGPRLTDSALVIAHLLHPDQIEIPPALSNAFELFPLSHDKTRK